VAAVGQELQERDEDEVACQAFEDEYGAEIASTDPLERLNKEIGWPTESRTSPR